MRTCRSELERRRSALLGLIERRSDVASGEAHLSLADFCRELNVSRERLRHSMNWLVEHGCLSVKARYLPNGSQIENAYRLTDKGKSILRENANHDPLS